MASPAKASPKQWIIRAADERDVDGLARCIDAAYRRYLEWIIDLPPMSKGIAEEIKEHKVFVAVEANEIVGGLILAEGADHLLISNVAVAPHYTGLGLGRVLMEHAERECLALGLRMLRLTTHVAMPENVKLYEHLGWKPAGGSGNKIFMLKCI